MKNSRNYEHVKKRAKERYRLDLSPQDYIEISRYIQHNYKKTLVLRQSHRTSVHKISQPTQMICIWDETKRTLVTVLPPDIDTVQGQYIGEDFPPVGTRRL